MPHRAVLLVVACLGLSMLGASAQLAPVPKPTPGTSSLLDGKSPQAPVPGLIVRIYAGGNATHLVAVLADGAEFKASIKPLAEAELRGKSKDNPSPLYHAFGFVILEKDADVKFDVGNNKCLVGRKEFGRGSYTQKMTKGKYPIEIERADHGQGQGGFSAVNAATGESVIFYTGEMLSRELNRSVKFGGITRKTVQLGTPPVN